MPKFARSKQTTERAGGCGDPCRAAKPGCGLGCGADRWARRSPIGPYFADYCCVPLKLIVEIDGPLHEAAKDARRDGFLRTQGYTVMRFSAEDAATNPQGVAETVLAEVQGRLRRLRRS